MRNNGVVTYCEREETRAPYVMKSTYEFRKDRGLHFLQRSCFWLLSKMGCNAIGEKVAVTRHTFMIEDFMEALHRQNVGIIEQYNINGTRLLIGNDAFMELTGSEEARQMINFTGEYGSGREIMGMKITVIPWMEGMLVVPRL